MKFYPAGETITRRLLDLPQQRMEWIVTGAEDDDLITAGFQRHQSDETRFIHPQSGDIYQLARYQYVDEATGELRYQCDHAVTVENELATRPMTILAMAGDGDDLIDPYDGGEDLIDGVLRHVTPTLEQVPQNLLQVAVWAARLAAWEFCVAPGTSGLMKKMVARGAIEQIPSHLISEAVIQVMASPRPSEFFRVLHRCGALRVLSIELDALFEHHSKRDGRNMLLHSESSLPDAMQSLDQAAAETANISSVMKKFYIALGDKADKIFNAFGLDSLM